ncbi:MAG: aminopeptidase P family protein, partial [Lachnospiraceae bacterium]|nr:aminopeptidase P family protein [Lachnospiraceae bacterium]
MSTVNAERISALRASMKKAGADWYFITSDDHHSSEYVADYFKVREYFDGFHGENAFLLVNAFEAKMWTDGRFFIQAEKELAGSGIELMRMGDEGVPTVQEYLKENMKEGQSLFFDGKSITCSYGSKLEKIVTDKKGTLSFDKDLAGELWTGRPALPSSKIFILKDEVSGENTVSKLKRIREKMKEYSAGAHFLSSLDDIMWITNLRADDIPCNPVALSYLLITGKEAYAFLQEAEATDEVKDYLKSVGIETKDYFELDKFLSGFKYDGAMLIDEGSLNYFCVKTFKDKGEVINKRNPSKLMKAIKNETELKRLKEIYILDSVCVTKLAYWVKKNIGKRTITEIDASDYIDDLRSKIPGFIELSFPTISGYGPNAAMMHYSATPENHAVCKPEGMLLVDSGGQYEQGTTDVTRTFALGPVTDEMKLHFTKTAAGMLALADAKFLYGCTGRNVDILARLPLWELNIDYKCGTGHGVGYILNVHEGPQSIRWKFAEGMTEALLEDGMIMSDEPGVYIEGSHGIRLENVILCKKGVQNGDGQFMEFEHLTYTPIDRDLIDVKYLSEKERERLNAYHKAVYDKTA